MNKTNNNEVDKYHVSSDSYDKMGKEIYLQNLTLNNLLNQGRIQMRKGIGWNWME